MIFWKGWGILGLLFPILIVSMLVLLGYSDEDRAANWIYFIGLTLSAVPVWFLGKHLNRDKDEVYVNERTGKRVKMGYRHTLFFIPLQYYAIVYPILGIAPLIGNLLD